MYTIKAYNINFQYQLDRIDTNNYEEAGEAVEKFLKNGFNCTFTAGCITLFGYAQDYKPKPKSDPKLPKSEPFTDWLRVGMKGCGKYNTKNLQNLGAAVAYQAIEDYFNTEEDKKKPKILCELRSEWCTWLTDGMSVKAAKELEEHPGRIYRMYKYASKKLEGLK